MRLPKVTFQGQDHSEEYQFYFRQHWMRMLWPAFRALLGTVAIFGIGYAIFWSGVSTSIGKITTGSILFLFFLVIQLQFIQRFYAYFLTVVIVTDQKVHRIKKNLFSIDDHQTISLWALQEMKKSQRGPIQNLLGFGSIILEAQDTQLRLHFVPKISAHYASLLRLLAQAQQQAAANGMR